MAVVAALATSFSSPAAAQFTGSGALATLLQVDVESVELEGAYSRNGSAFPADFLDSGNVLISSKEGDPVLLGNTRNGSYGPLRVVSGRYQPQFSSFFETPTAPRSDRFLFASPVMLEADQMLDLDVPAMSLSLSFLLNGATFPGSSSGQVADFYLRHVASGREVNIGTSLQAGNTFFVIPGVYDVIYAHRSGSLIPANTRAVIIEGLVVDQSMSVDVDVPMVYRTLTYMLNGVPFPNSGLDYGWILLEDLSTETSFFAGRTHTPALLRVIPGTYRVIYSSRQSQGVTPGNSWAIIDDALLIDSTGITGFVVEVTAHSVDPVFLMDGLAFPGNGLAYGRILYRGGDGSFSSLGRTDQIPDSEVLIEGTYDFYYELRQPSLAVPANPLTRFGTGIVVDKTGPLLLNVETAVMDLDVLLDGAPFPESGLNYGRILLVDPETKAELDLGRTYQGPFDQRLIRGEYEIVYRIKQGVQGTLVPRNTHRVIERGLEVEGPTSALIDIRTQLVAPRFSLDGFEFPNTMSHHAQFFLRDADGDEIVLGRSHEAAADRRVIEGAYQVDYEWRSGSQVPLNPRESIKFIWVPEPSFLAGLSVSVLGLGGAGSRRRQPH